MQSLSDSGKAFTLGADSEEYQKLSTKYAEINQELEKQKSIQSEITQKQAEAASKVEETKIKMQQLTAEGKAFTLGSGTQQFANYGRDLATAKNELSTLNAKHDVLVEKQNEAAEGYKKIGKVAKSSLEKANKSVKSSGKSLNALGLGFKNILKYAFGIRSLFVLFNKLREYIKEGFENLYAGNEKFKSSVDELKASATTMKNALISMFAPIVETVIPYLQKAMDYLSNLFSMVAQFTAAITGQKTYTKAIKQTTDAIKDETKATEGYLSPLDEINKYKTTDDTGDTDTTAAMFEEMPVDNKVLDFIDKIKNALAPVLEYLKKLKDIFMDAFWDALGDWETRWESIKENLKKIKDILIDIFTDPAVVEAADKWVQSVVDLLGSLVGAIASIAFTIADNLIGGIEKYLEQNSERIKSYLVSMFNVWTEVNQMLSEFFESFAYVFEAFSSEQGKQLTANLIGIFADAFMGVTELASKIFRDLIQIIVQPFNENKEALRTALEGFLSILAEVTGTVKQAIDDTFDKLNEVYDTYFKPFFDSIAEGLSEIVGEILAFWNDSLQPMLMEWAAQFDTLWKEHLQPLVNAVVEFFGKVVELLQTVWEKWLKPLVDWIVANVLPKILPILNSIWETASKVIGDIADLLTDIVNVFSGVIDLIVALINGDWDGAWEAAKSIVENTFNALADFLTAILDAIVGIIETAWDTITSGLEVVGQAIYDLVVTILTKVKDYVVSALNWISSNIGKILGEIKEIWDKAWDRFLEKVSNIWDSIVEKVSNAVEKIKGWIENITSAFDNIKSKISSIGSGLSWRSSSSSYTSSYSSAYSTLSSSSIPGYATGQVIPASMKKHLAWLGDNNRETEVVSPLSTIEQAVSNAMSKSGGTGKTGNITLKLVVSGKEIMEAVVDAAKLEQASTGENPLLV
jgi:phage-related protein